MERSITLKELKALTGAPNMAQATHKAYQRIERRKWHKNGAIYKPMGIDWGNDKVSFMLARNISKGACTVRVLSLSIADALDTVSGDLSGAHITL